MNQERTTGRELHKELELNFQIMKSKDQTIQNLENEIGFLIQDHTRISGLIDCSCHPGKKFQKKPGDGSGNDDRIRYLLMKYMMLLRGLII